MCHAGHLHLSQFQELNAILNKNGGELRGCRLYVALFPCNECAKLIIQSGIREIVFYGDKYHDKMEFGSLSTSSHHSVASRKLLDSSGVKYWQHQPKKKQITIDFDSVNQ